MVYFVELNFTQSLSHKFLGFLCVLFSTVNICVTGKNKIDNFVKEINRNINYNDKCKPFQQSFQKP